MPKIKLSDYARANGISYVTANRHYHMGLIPNAEQLKSGTILVEDEPLEPNMIAAGTNDAMSLFLKKTVEFSKNDSSVEDFAAYVISNFQLKLNGQVDVAPRYSKNKPKTEEIQKHFQQFLPDKEKSDQLKAIKSLIKEKNQNKDVVPFIEILNAESPIVIHDSQIDFPANFVNEVFDASTAVPFQPTQKEILSATQIIEEVEAPKKRGRKPTLGKK